MLILIAGPYRSGTNDDPALIRKNVQEMESYALPIFRAGHIPVLGEWLACRWSSWPGRARLAMTPSLKSFTPSLPGFWKSVMPCCGSADPPTAPMKWCESDGAWA